jgi:hypothetical protein
MNPSQNPSEPEEEKPVPRSGRAWREHRPVVAYTALPRRRRKNKRYAWLIPVAAVLGVMAVIGLVLLVTYPSQTPTPGADFVVPSSESQLTLSGADRDMDATLQAVTDLKAGTDQPPMSALPDTVKAQILDGTRIFFSLPVVASPDNIGAQFRVDLNGLTYSVYELTKAPLAVVLPLRAGDEIDVTCVSVPPGKGSLVAVFDTVLNPVQITSLAVGQKLGLRVNVGAAGTNYDWFQQGAKAGTPLAQYGLGHMYQYGLGVPQDTGQALDWYRKAAAQNYPDARTQLQKLGAP